MCDKLYCDRCENDFEFIYCKTLYNGNTDNNDYCGECFYLTFGEYFVDTEFRIVDEKNDATNVKGRRQ